MTGSIYSDLVRMIGETNGISLEDTLSLLIKDTNVSETNKKVFSDYIDLLNNFKINKVSMDSLLKNKVSQALYKFLSSFPLKYREEHIHLTGSLSAGFVTERLKSLLKEDSESFYEAKIQKVFPNFEKSKLNEDYVTELMTLKEGELFDRYLEILILPKLILNTKQSYKEASYHMAAELYHQHNVGAIRLKFTFSRITTQGKEASIQKTPLSSEDSVLGLYEGFAQFQREYPDFEFILSPCFRKEPNFFNATEFQTKKEDFENQVNQLLKILKENPQLEDHIVEVDTVGSELNMHRKEHFQEMKIGLRKLQSYGIKIRSHHGETWYTLRRGIQSVDNAMNIWHVDAVEHGLSLGVKPNLYFHRIYQEVIDLNTRGEQIQKNSFLARELEEFHWNNENKILPKLYAGQKLTEKEQVKLVKVKFHTAREVERYQHEVLNRMIDKDLSVIALPSSNKKLTGQFDNYKDHPFSWWEKKGVKLGVGTDNFVTLNTNYIREMLILLLTDSSQLKITKLLMVCTGIKQRALLSRHLWTLRKESQA